MYLCIITLEARAAGCEGSAESRASIVLGGVIRRVVRVRRLRYRFGRLGKLTVFCCFVLLLGEDTQPLLRQLCPREGHRRGKSQRVAFLQVWGLPHGRVVIQIIRVVTLPGVRLERRVSEVNYTSRRRQLSWNVNQRLPETLRLIVSKGKVRDAIITVSVVVLILLTDCGG